MTQLEEKNEMPEPASEFVETVMDAEKQSSTADVPEDIIDSHHKSKAERRLVLKADCLIVPLASPIYFVAYLDRNSIGNARLLGLEESLHLTPEQYYNCLMMFFVGYIIFMLPGNILLRFFVPHQQLSAAVITFGALLCGMAAAVNYETVLALRILIGSSQAFMQGLGLYISLWYRRDEVATRGAIYYSAATVSGKEPWRWLFLIEGLMAVAVGILVFIFLPRFPDSLRQCKSTWPFTSAEVDPAVARSSSYNTTGAKVVPYQIWVTLKDPKSWTIASLNAGIAMGISSVGSFLPTFIRAFGYTAQRAQLFSAIPYACAGLTLLTVCTLSDRLNKKGVFMIGCLSMSSIGYVLLLVDVQVKVKMFAACLIVSGLYPSVILLISWLGINTGGFTKRGTTWAMAEVFGQCFSIMGQKMYDTPPRFVKGHSIVLGFLLYSVVTSGGLIWWMDRCNKKREREISEFAERGERHPHVGKSLEEVYDFHVEFRYIL
ncbi:MFS general substrate transporter [Cadophora sp. DSE1049]|nr:MFS general substrate transporter [Cadophora sp. DSE1049]